jgi:hypothetical protein
MMSWSRAIFLMLFLNVTSCFSQNGDSLCLINSSFVSDSINQLNFFKCYPNDFNSYYKLYGKEGKLRKFSEEHTRYLFKSEFISKEDLIIKIISISKNGKYEPDGIAYFKRNVEGLYFKNPQLFSDCLIENFSISEINGFFNFFFDSSQHYNADYPTFLRNLDSKYESIKTISAEVYRNKSRR